MSDPLEDLDREIRGQAPSGRLASGTGIQKVRYSHDAMIDLIIQNPIVSQNELALVFGYTAGWVSQIIASDAFQMRLAERKDELIDPTIRATVELRFRALVIRSQELLLEMLNKPTHQIPANLVIKTLEVSSKAAGFGAKPPEVQPGEDVVERLASRLVSLQRRVRNEGEVIDVKAEEIPEANTLPAVLKQIG